MSNKEVAMTDGPPAPASGSNGTAAAVARQPEAAQGETSSEDRVAELRRQYLEGAYSVDATQLSAKIIHKHLE